MESAEPAEECCVKVAVHIRPLIGNERLQGCKDCVNVVVPGKLQIQIGAHSFTFDHVYGSTGSPPFSMFTECVAPLVDGLFQGYNATVLAYGQTGSGKTYTMGTNFRDRCETGLIPQVMNTLFNKVERLKHQNEFQMHVSFIEILNDEVKDLLDSTSSSNSETTNGHAGKVPILGRPPIQIRETSNGLVTLAGSTEVAVGTLQEMAACLEQGSLSRATGSTNMNNQSSRSHAIFTITLEQIRKIQSVSTVNYPLNEDMGEELLSAELHLVDLAGSERAKRTGSDGQRFREGIHINKGLLALGNVISALGDEKKRKECAHIPYRDSKLTRLLQGSLGGNSKTFMIACISPADINADETLNTLKYANRARNIQNKLIVRFRDSCVNRDIVSTEMQKMRQQLDYLQAQLLALDRGGSRDGIQVLKEKIAYLETSNVELHRKLHEYQSGRAIGRSFETVANEIYTGVVNNDKLKRSSQCQDSSDYSLSEAESFKEINRVAAKELDHTLLRNCMDRELNELNKRLEEKEFEMKHCGSLDTEAIKQHYQKRVIDLEEEKRILEQERDRLLAAVQSLSATCLSATSDGQTHAIHAQRLKELESQILDLKKKQENHVKLMKQKQKSEEAVKQLKDEILVMKAQKHKIKREADYFREWKTSRDRELLQLRKEGRKNMFERHKLQALNQRQKMVLRRKTEEAAIATKRLKELLEARKCSAHESSVYFSGHQTTTGQSRKKSFQRWLDHELEVMVKVHEVRIEYERKSQVRAALAEELAVRKKIDEPSSDDRTPEMGPNAYSSLSSISPNARMKRIASLENMLNISSNTLVTMASQLSEAEGRGRSFSGRGHWNQLRSMGEAKNLLQRMFTAATDARCQLWEKETEIKELKEQLIELVTLLKKSESQKNEILKEHLLWQDLFCLEEFMPFLGECTSSHHDLIVTYERVEPENSLKQISHDLSGHTCPTSPPEQRQPNFSPGIANGMVRDSAAFLDQTRKMLPIGSLLMKTLAANGKGGKLWRWKRSHHRWLLQFKWRWQKPWRLSESIKHSEEILKRSRPNLLQDVVDVIPIDPDLQFIDHDS